MVYNKFQWFTTSALYIVDCCWWKSTEMVELTQNYVIVNTVYIVDKYSTAFMNQLRRGTICIAWKNKITTFLLIKNKGWGFSKLALVSDKRRQIFPLEINAMFVWKLLLLLFVLVVADVNHSVQRVFSKWRRVYGPKEKESSVQSRGWNWNQN